MRDDVRSLPVLGIFQRVNAATAITVLEQLDAGLRPSRDAVARGFATLAIPGRMELISGKPPVLFDVAHNVEKATSLVASLRERFAGRRIHYVVAIGESKDARHILETLAELPSTFTFTSFSTAGRRAIPPAILAATAESFGAWGRVIGDPIEALTVTRRVSEIDDLVVVTGSTFVVAELRAVVRADAGVRGVLDLRGVRIAWGTRTYVMGIVNVTPDSFSGDGLEDAAQAVAFALTQWESGADLLDFGGESTRPGHQPVLESTEIARVVPVIRAVRERLVPAPISVDTYKPGVLRAAHEAGADIVNSVWGASPRAFGGRRRTGDSDRRDAQSEHNGV